MKKEFFVLAIFALASCAEKEEPVPFDESYFPLEVGNVWKYEHMGPSGIHVESITAEIIGTTDINGRTYHMMKRTYQYVDPQIDANVDTLNYRFGKNGFIYLLQPFSSRELNFFRLGAVKGESWKIKLTSSQLLFVTASDISPYNIGNNTVQNCRTFSFDIPGVIDDESITVLAPGVGILMQGSAEAGTMTLKRATINGVNYEF